MLLIFYNKYQKFIQIINKTIELKKDRIIKSNKLIIRY